MSMIILFVTGGQTTYIIAGLPSQFEPVQLIESLIRRAIEVG